MKDLVVKIGQDYLAWGAIGIGLSVGAVILVKSKSIGKALTFGLGCAAFAFLCFYPELVMTKAFDFLKMLVNLLKFT